MKKIIPFFVLFLLSISHYSKAQDTTVIQKMLGASNTGKEFWFSVPPGIADNIHTNFVKIYVVSSINTVATVEVPGKGYFKSKDIIANTTAEFSLNPSIAQPFEKNAADSTPPDQLYLSAGIHVYAQDPVVVYCVVQYYSKTEGFLPIPVSSLGIEYYISGIETYRSTVGTKDYLFPNTCCIVAAFDGTKARITLGGTVNTTTIGGKKNGDTWDLILNKGDVYVFSTDSYGGELTGSKIISTKPIGVVTGNMCAEIPPGCYECNYIVEMDFPVFVWGSSYLIPSIQSHKYSPQLKILAGKPEASIYKNGTLLVILHHAGGKVGDGYVTCRLSDSGFLNTPVVVTSNNPIAVTYGNTDCYDNLSDLSTMIPFTMNLIPAEQFTNEITTCTPGILGGTSFPLNYILLIYPLDSTNKMPDDLMIAGPVSGNEIIWKPVRTTDTSVDVVYKYAINGKKYAQKTITLPSDGVYKIKGNSPFGAYSVGFSDIECYGYPSSLYLKDRTKKDIEKPAPYYLVCCNGLVDDGMVTDMPDDNNFRTNLAMIYMHTDLSYNYQFKYDDFIPGNTRTTHWTLRPIDQSKDAKAVITFADRSGNDTTIIIDYKYSTLELTPKLRNFGPPVVGNVVVKPFLLKNLNNEDKMVDTIILKKKNGGFTLLLSGFKMPYLLKSGDSLQFFVQFNPSDTASVSDSIGVLSGMVFAYLGRVEAGSPSPVLSSLGTLDYGLVYPGWQKVKDISLGNIGQEDLRITKLQGPYSGYYTTDFDFSDTNPLVIPPNGSKTYHITFTSIYGKAYIYDTINFVTNTQKGSEPLFLSGQTGTPTIKVTDINCGTIYSLDQLTKKLTIFNDGTADLTIIGYNITGNTGISLLDSIPPSPSKPWTVPKLIYKEATVGIKPNGYGKVEGTVTFINDANGDKNYSNITAFFTTDVLENPFVLENEVSVYPNPATGKITISASISSSTLIFIEIIDLNGKTADSFSLANNGDNVNDKGKLTTGYDTYRLPNGIYFIRVTSGSTTNTGRFTISR